MMHVRLWLPPGAPGLDKKLLEVVEDWSRKWFGDDEVSLRYNADLTQPSGKAENRRACGAHGWLEMSGDALIALGTAALHLGGNRPRPEQDRALLQSVGDDCAAALCDAIGAAFDEKTGNGARQARLAGVEPAVGWTIERPSTSLRLAFFMSEEGRVSALRDAMPPLPPAGPLDSPVRALAPLSVELSAVLGRCKLRVSELSSLTPGDVIVFEREVDATLPLAINTAAAPRGACTVSRDEDTLVLEIAIPLAGNEK